MRGRVAATLRRNRFAVSWGVVALVAGAFAFGPMQPASTPFFAVYSVGLLVCIGLDYRRDRDALIREKP